MSTDPSTVRQTVSNFLVRVKKGRDVLPDDLALFGDGLALDSLEAAGAVRRAGGRLRPRPVLGGW